MPGPGADATTRSGFTYRGIDHVSWWFDEYTYGSAADSRAELLATRANWAGLLVTWYMTSRESNEIAAAGNSPTDASVQAALRDLRGRGLKVMLKPHVDVQDGTWRAQIRPRDPAAWFASYRVFLLHWARLAQEAGAEMLCVGTELASLSGSDRAAEWTALLAEVRTVYRGLLTYAANAVTPGDEFTSVAFWAQLDVAGLDAYVPLTDSMSPSRADLVRGWSRGRYGDDMLLAFRNWAKSHGKPVVMTEVGYRSGDGTNRAPWDWGASLAHDPGEQADAYDAAYQVFSRETEWFKGVFWWAWSVPAPGPSDTGYDPRRKPAADVLRSWHGQ
jgi:hypothetical protein